MNLRHRVRINIAQPDGSQKEPIITSGIRKVPQRLLNSLFGELTDVLVLAPGQSVQSVEICEARGGKTDERDGRDHRRPAQMRCNY